MDSVLLFSLIISLLAVSHGLAGMWFYFAERRSGKAERITRQDLLTYVQSKDFQTAVNRYQHTGDKSFLLELQSKLQAIPASQYDSQLRSLIHDAMRRVDGQTLSDSARRHQSLGVSSDLRDAAPSFHPMLLLAIDTTTVRRYSAFVTTLRAFGGVAATVVMTLAVAGVAFALLGTSRSYGSAPSPLDRVAPGDWVQVVNTEGTTGLRLRESPAADGALVAIIPNGTKLRVLERPVRGPEGTYWFRVALDQRWGYVSGDYLAPTTPPIPTANLATPEIPTDSTGRGAAIVDIALSQLGKPYAWGATGPDAFDTSGLVLYAARRSLGLTLPRVASEQITAGIPVDIADLAPGDLVFFQNTYAPGITHVGIYIGNNQWVSASDETAGVIVVSLDEPYWKSRYAGARRIT